MHALSVGLNAFAGNSNWIMYKQGETNLFVNNFGYFFLDQLHTNNTIQNILEYAMSPSLDVTKYMLTTPRYSNMELSSSPTIYWATCRPISK